MLALVGYMHFRIAHIHGHHVRAATPADPTSARRGGRAPIASSVRAAIGGQVAEAWSFETARLRRRGERRWSVRNRMLRYAVIEALVGASFARARREGLRLLARAERHSPW